MIADQPPPIANDRPGVWSLVIKDMQARDQLGRERYGVPLQPGNGRDALVDAYHEALDGLAYSKQAILEGVGVRAGVAYALFEAIVVELRQAIFERDHK